MKQIKLTLGLIVFVQDEAPADSNTVSSNEDQTSGDALEPEQESPILETKQIPSPLVWNKQLETTFSSLETHKTPPHPGGMASSSLKSEELVLLFQ